MAKKKDVRQKNSIDKLARMVANGFSETNAKIDHLDKKTEHLDKKTDYLANQIDDLTNRMDRGFKQVIAVVTAVHDVRVDALEHRMDRIEKKIGFAK